MLRIHASQGCTDVLRKQLSASAAGVPAIEAVLGGAMKYFQIESDRASAPSRVMLYRVVAKGGLCYIEKQLQVELCGLEAPFTGRLMETLS